ncbi:hypothetical protein A3K73_02905 [Candidatus Pacearchaeota archaeon RBG_13_36_9]|nr:MAG: hypothetical protein A3K73_02905 [Candidatus Pacearchaeota archaeon RBG_13_36_9]
MSKPKYTPEGLPVLTRKTLEMHFVEEEKLDKESDDGLMKVMERRAEEIFGENPVLEEALDRFCKKYSLDGLEEAYAQAAGIYVIQLMKRQAEINKLEEDNR